MDSLPPIPTPPGQRWREFKIHVLPVIVFLIVTAIIAVMWKNFLPPPGTMGEAPPETALSSSFVLDELAAAGEAGE